MTRIENHCCDCAAPGYPCRGNLCPDRHVPVLYCDNTRCTAHHTGADRLFIVGGVELCMDCVASIAERNGLEVEDLIEGEV